MAPHPNGERGRIGEDGKRKKACRNEIYRGRIGNATGIRREIRRLNKKSHRSKHRNLQINVCISTLDRICNFFKTNLEDKAGVAPAMQASARARRRRKKKN
jgi:hypothetical protein